MGKFYITRLSKNAEMLLPKLWEIADKNGNAEVLDRANPMVMLERAKGTGLHIKDYIEAMEELARHDFFTLKRQSDV